MAITEKVVFEVKDDLTGEDIGAGGGGTAQFGYGGTSYELELTDANRRALEKLLQPYIDVARIVKPAPKNARTAGAPAAAAVRKWARGQGLDVPQRGKLGDDVIAAYKARNKPKTQATDSGVSHEVAPDDEGHQALPHH